MSASRALSPFASLAGIDHLLGNDELALAFRGFWKRMHGTTSKLVAAAMKYVEWSPNGTAAQRCVWEVCEWSQGNSATWTFVCWLINGQGMWLRPFASKEEALHFFEQSPDVVMRPRDVATEDVAEGARPRRAS